MNLDISPTISLHNQAILQVLPAFKTTGGVERGTLEVAKAIIAAGGRAYVASAGGDQVGRLENSAVVHHHLPLHSKNPLIIRKNAARLADYIKQEGITLIHARSRAPAWSAQSAAKRTGIPYVTTVHGQYGYASSLKRYYNAVMMRAERVIAVSQFIAGYIIQVYGTNKESIRTIPRGVDLGIFNPEQVSLSRVRRLFERYNLNNIRNNAQNSDSQVLMMPARLTPTKGHAVLLEAMLHLHDRNVCCLFLGGGIGEEAAEARLKKRIKQMGLVDRVHLVGPCSDMPAAYLLANVVLVPSVKPEAFGRTIVEAQAMGRLVIAADHGGARETIIHGKTGWLVPVGDSVALAKAIAHVLDLSPQAREPITVQAQQSVRRTYCMETMCAKTLRVYDELLSPNHDG